MRRLIRDAVPGPAPQVRMPPADQAPWRIALLGEHASPLTAPDDAGSPCLHLARLAGALARAGHQVDLFTRRAGSMQRDVEHLPDGVRVVQVPAGPPRPLPQEALFDHADAFARAAIRFMRRQGEPYDIVHASSYVSSMVAQELKAALGLPFVMSVHLLCQRAQRTAPDARIESALMRADRILASCPQAGLDLERLHRVAPARIAVSACGFDPGELWPAPMAQARAALGLDPARFTILQLGRMAPRKGIDTVIQGLAMLRQCHGVDAQLLVVGGAVDEALELARLRSLALDLGVGARVHFAGWQPRASLRDWYSAANVFASMPWHDPVAMTTIEAMACARPVVGAEVGAIKDSVHDGITGYVVPSRDPAALAERLARLQRRPGLACAMGDAGRRRACEHHTWRQVASGLLAVYGEVLHEARTAVRPATLTM